MTQLIVSIDNPSMLEDIRAAIRMIRGVVSVSPNQTPNDTTIAAINDAKAGNTIHCGTFDSYKKLVS